MDKQSAAIITTGNWDNFYQDPTGQRQLLDAMPPLMQRARWFGGKGRTLLSVNCDHCLRLQYQGHTFFLFILEAVYENYEPDYYLLPLAKVESATPESPGWICPWQGSDGFGFIIDATFQPDFQRCIFDLLRDGKKIETNSGHLLFDRGKYLPETENYYFSINPVVEQSNSCVLYNDRFFMKIYRKLFRETNPESEMLKFLTEKGHFTHIPAYAGSLTWERKDTPPVTLALMMQKVDARKDNWASTGDELNDFLHAFLKGSFSIHEFVFENVALLARRTAEMHLALSHSAGVREFAPVHFDNPYRGWLFRHLQQLLDGRMEMVKNNKHRLDEEALRMVEVLTKKRNLILKFFEQVNTRPLQSLRTRIHGDYHLGQVLYTGGDFVIIDFEGEPESSITDRKIKHSPMKDVAGMIRSFHYAVCAKLYFSQEAKHRDAQGLHRASDRWFYLIRDTFLEAYMEAIGKDTPLYHSKSEVNFLFHLHLIEKAIYELGYELNGRPDWVKIPLKGIEQVVNELEKFSE